MDNFKKQCVVAGCPITKAQMIQLEYRHSVCVTQAIHVRSIKATFPICPKCHGTLCREYMAFCDQCGQKLGWSKWNDVKVSEI